MNPFPDESALRSLWTAVWGEPGPINFEAVLAKSLGHLGAYHRDRLIGFVNLAWDGGAHAFILDTSVHPDHRRQGIGSLLVMKAVEMAREHQVLWLHVDYEAQLAPFYEHCGFRPTTAGVMRLKP